MTSTHDVALVLGACVGADGRPSRALLRRVAHGVALYHAGRVGRILMAGGVVCHPSAEALVMRDLALAAGVPVEALLVETRSRNTLENAMFCRPILAAAGLRRVLLVTDGSHLPRALYTFRRLGIPCRGESAAGGRTRPLAVLRELVALLVYVWCIERALRG